MAINTILNFMVDGNVVWRLPPGSLNDREIPVTCIIPPPVIPSSEKKKEYSRKILQLRYGGRK